MITLDNIKNNPIIDSFIRNGNQYLGILGFTDHSYQHLTLVSNIAFSILEKLGYPPRDAELAAIAGYLHDIGNVVSRKDHGISGAVIVYPILMGMGMKPDEVAIVLSSIANHEEQYGQPVNTAAAALIMADKSHVHRSRVRNREIATFDIHDRVNYAAECSFVKVDTDRRTITMDLTIDIKICPVMEYFEIFLTRMMLCRRAAVFLKCNFELIINGSKLL